MNPKKGTNLVIFFILLGAIVAFAFSYNASVTKFVADSMYNDREILHSYNAEIIKKLVATENTEQWSEIVEQYEDIVIVIENSDNKVITRSAGRSWTALDVKVQTPFDFEGNAYVIKTSVYLLRDYLTDVRVMVRFIFIEFLIGLAALSLLIFAVYSIMLRPYRVLYKAIEEYDKTGELRQVRIRGYAGQVYRRFVSLTNNLDNQQKRQKRIIACISHDIKTPITSIMGYAEQLQKDGLDSQRRERYLQTLYGKSEQITMMLNEFDDYLSLNVSDINKKEINLSELYSIIIGDYADELENNGIDFEVMLQGDGEALLELDIMGFKRVLGNIISNSVKHLIYKRKIIRATLDSDKEKVYIYLEDSGDGVEIDKYELIFEPLFTSDKGRRVAGLGLAICREIIELHNGVIYAEKSRLGGLKICIELNRTDSGIQI